jgi:nitrogenase molybdenum-iron protein beta chain
VPGSEDSLRSLIEGCLAVLDARLLVVMTGCIVELTGDDVAAVVREYRKKGVSVVLSETAGFKGDIHQGYEWVIQSIIQQFVLRKEAPAQRGLVNLWIPTPCYDSFWEGNQEAVVQMLEQSGLRVNRLFGYGSDIENWKEIPRAACNILLSAWVGLSTMEMLENRFGTPCFHYPVLPAGAAECEAFLLGLFSIMERNPEQPLEYLKREEKRFYHFFKKASDFLSVYNTGFPDRFYIIADSTRALSFFRFLYADMGITPGKQYITDAVPEKHRERIKALFVQYVPSAAIAFVDESFDIEADIGQCAANRRPLVLASGCEQQLASKLDAAFVEIAFPVSNRLVLNRSYAGYNGGLTLLEDVASSIFDYAGLD